jgi:hypothetical protein
MKPAPVLTLGAAAVITAFLLGRWTAPAADNTKNEATDNGKLSRIQRPRGESASAPVKSAAERSAGMNRYSEQSARRMTSQQRLDLLGKGALVFDSNKQAEMLCGVINALTKEEMQEAMRLLAEAQDGGNACAQVVWDTLWKQWGRVDPVECVKYINETSGTKSRTDARHVMEGWLEANPEAALAWAKDAKNTRLDGAAAAMAMTWNAGGDLKQLEEAILARPPGDMAAKDCLWDYFDLSSLATDSPTAAQVYEKLPPALQESAWSVTLQRLTYTDPQAGKDWLEQHAGDPGHNYQETQRLVFGLSRQDAEGTAKWAARLPVTDGPGPHPAAIAIGQWLRSDPPAAKAWIATLPADSPWAGTFTNE